MDLDPAAVPVEDQAVVPVEAQAVVPVEDPAVLVALGQADRIAGLRTGCIGSVDPDGCSGDLARRGLTGSREYDLVRATVNLLTFCVQ